MDTNRQTCFVIMPFGKTTDEHTEEYWTKHFENFLKPLIEENPNLEARRSKPLRGDILNEIITDLVTSPIVVANLTDKNANVCWELGVRQSFKHGTITIAEGVTDLPFDVAGKGTLQYHPKDYIQNAKFRKDFKEAIEDCLLNPGRPDSQVLEALSGRGTLFEIFRRDEAIRRLNAVLSECNYNLNLLTYITDRANKNMKKPKEREIPIRRFMKIAMELLLTNQYVDEDGIFFVSVENCWNWTDALNIQLNVWKYDPDETENYIKTNGNTFKKIIGTLQAKVEVARDKVSKKF
ncbi:MAG: hypothetical protein O8C61_13325 [Candidatus Methanoperedens sp.]|nr:hypothetical protein [Candidatus Methanoperedens sp.]